MKVRPQIFLYSDGGADPNPGTGGFGVILKHNDHKKEFSEGYKLTTNNRMELLAVIHGLEQIKVEAEVEVYSDSKYVVDAINKGWLTKWESNNWYRRKVGKVLNIDLWKRLLELMTMHSVKFSWVKGHNGHPENERCDELAGIAYKASDLKEDHQYIERINSPSNIGKITKEGDTCRKCGTAVIKRINKLKKIKKSQSYYFEYYFFCPDCKALYHVEKAKRKIEHNSKPLFGS